MNCKLCLDLNENSFKIDSNEGTRSNVITLLQRYFPFCFENDEDKNGHICHKCWWKVETFHLFYTHIENIHRSPVELNETVFAQTISFEHTTGILSIKTEDIISSDLKVLSPEKKEPARDVKELKPANSGSPKKPKKANETLCNKYVTKKTHPKATCKYCKKDIQKYYLERHIQAVHSTEPKKVTNCSRQGCNKTFPSQHLLERHLREGHAKVKCEYCLKDVRKRYLQRHVQAVHSLELQTVCDLCGKVWKTKEAYRVHYISEHTEHERVQCDICQNWFKNKYRLRYHFLQLHTNTGPIVCTVCGHISKNKKASLSHQRIHQVDYKTRYICDVCGKGCSDKTHLREHSLIHTGITDTYKCDLCDKTFSSRSGLRSHSIVHEEYTVLNKCNYCDKSYQRKSTLRTHITRSHRVEHELEKMTKKVTQLSNLSTIKNTAKSTS